MKSPWYKDFFQKYYLGIYRDNLTPAKTKKEVAFVVEALALPKGSKILDLCGGWGRHAIPLAKKGYKVTILDLNKKFLAIAKREARKQKVKISTVGADMRRVPFSNEFDAVINMFTAFGYLENDKEDGKVLDQVYKALKPGGKFLIDVIDRDWLLANYQPRDWRKAGHWLILENRQFNPATKRNFVKITIIDTENSKTFSTYHHERIYNFNELKKILSRHGLKTIRRYSDMDREIKNSPRQSKRLLLLAIKK